MRKPPPLINSHRLARLIVYAQAMLARAAAVFFGELIANRRRIRQRYRLLSLDKLAHLVRNLMIARAAALFGQRRPRRPQRNDAPSGFRRRTRARSALRAIAGSRLRRLLSSGDAAAGFAKLTHILRNLDAYARAFLAPRAKNGVNCLLAIIPTHPPRAHVCTLAAPAAAFANTS
jgi:hypothetical protein